MKNSPYGIDESRQKKISFEFLLRKFYFICLRKKLNLRTSSEKNYENLTFNFIKFQKDVKNTLEITFRYCGL